MYKSTFMGLNTALRGVLAQQTALDVTGHNISNLNTEGYTRQRAEMVATTPWSSAAWNAQVAPGQMGTGVEVLRLERLRDSYVDQNVRQQFGRQTSAQTLVDQLAQVESAFQEPGSNGLSQLMTSFWDAAGHVAANPQDPAARQKFAEAADALTSGFRQLDSDLTQIQAQSNTRLDDTVTEINSIAGRIAALNVEVSRAIQRGQQPNDMLDERDRLMDSLSKLTNYTSSQNANGEVTISLGTTFGNLVDPTVPGGVNAFARTDLDAAFAAGELTSGRAFADEQLWDPAGVAGSPGTGIIDTIRGQLDLLVNELVTDINAAHSAVGTSFDLTGTQGGVIFDAAGITAGTFRLDVANNILANPALIAAANSWAAPGEPTNGAGMANLISTLRTATQAALGVTSYETYYSSVVSGLGNQADAAQNAATNADQLVDLAVGRREQVSGVSLDEEMTNMLRFQHAYNASARVLTTMDDALDTIINRMGRVGL